MTIADWTARDLEQFIRGHLERPETRREITLKAIGVQPVTAPTFATGWSNYGAPYSNAGYYRDRNRVYLRGAVKNGGTGTGAIFTLPSGYRPAATVQFSTVIFGGNGVLAIDSAGVVTDATFSAGSKVVTVLDGFSFRIA